MAPELKLGFIVEGNADKAFVETLAARILGPSWRPHAIRIGGKAALPSMHDSISLMLDDSGYVHVVVLIDADTYYPPDVEREQRKVEEILKEHHFRPSEVTVCLAVPELEAWLLADQLEQPEALVHPREELHRRLGTKRPQPDVIAALARNLDLDKARSRSPSLDHFLSTLERFAREPHVHASAAE